MICCLASAACPLRDTAAPLAACGGRKGIRAVYDAGIDLGHYGEVDQLAPAGAMAEFTAYVRRQSEEEAEAAFAPLRQAARSRGVEMRLHVVYVWTHDSFRVGEDGPTHQPVEHEAQIRLMEHLRNHHDERSMLVLRPADGDETVMAWKLAVEEHRPVALVLSRQNIKTLPPLGAIRREEAEQVAKGA